MSLRAFSFNAWGGIAMPGMAPEDDTEELPADCLVVQTLEVRTWPGEPAGDPNSRNNDTTDGPHDGYNDPTNTPSSGNNGQRSDTGDKSNRPQCSGPPLLKFRIPETNGMKKKRTDLKWFQKFDKLYDPDPEICFYAKIFGKSSDGSWDPDLLDKGTDARFSDYAAGVGALALKIRAITKKDAARYLAVWNTEGKFTSYRKHEGRAFLGPDRKPLVINGEPMCGDDPQWKGQESIWSLEEVHQCADYDPWLRTILFHEEPMERAPVDETTGKRKEIATTQTPTLNMIPRALQKQIMKENQELKNKMADMLRTYQSLEEYVKSLRAAIEIIEKDRRNLAHQRINGIQADITNMEKDIMEVAKAFENITVGNGIAVLQRIIGSLQRVTQACENKSVEFQKRTPIAISSSDGDEDDEQEGNGNREKGNGGNNCNVAKKRPRSSTSYNANIKSKKVTKHSFLNNSRHMPRQNQQLYSFLQSGNSLEDFFAPPERFFDPPPKNAAEYIRKHGNPMDEKQSLAMTNLPIGGNNLEKKQVQEKIPGVVSKIVATRIEEIEDDKLVAFTGGSNVSDDEFDKFGQREWIDLDADTTFSENLEELDDDSEFTVDSPKIYKPSGKPLNRSNSPEELDSEEEDIITLP